MRAAGSAAIAVVGLAALLGPRVPDPSLAIEAERLIHGRATVALDALDELRGAVDAALERARSAAAAVVSGDGAASPLLEEAAALISDAEAAVVPARRAVASLSAAAGARRPDAEAVPQPVAAGELTSIGTQLDASGEAADQFVALRGRGVGLPAVLEQALRALDRRAVDDATELVSRARADHTAIVAWETDLPTLPAWIETTDAMISAVEAILDGIRTGDEAAAAAGAERFAALGDEAGTADRALRIALSEGGSALTAAPLERLARALGGIEASRAAVAETMAEAVP
jgi:hypothetical protein